MDTEKNSLKRKLSEPIFMSRFKKSLYEKIRDDNAALRERLWSELEKEWERPNINCKYVPVTY